MLPQVISEPRNAGELFPFLFSFQKRNAWQHGSIGWMRVPWISHMDGTVKILRKNSFIFIPLLPSQFSPFLPLSCQEGKGGRTVVSAQQRHGDLSWRLYLSRESQSGSSGRELPLPTISPSGKRCLAGAGGPSAPALPGGLHFGGTLSVGAARVLTCCLVSSFMKWGNGLG